LIRFDKRRNIETIAQKSHSLTSLPVQCCVSPKIRA